MPASRRWRARANAKACGWRGRCWTFRNPSSLRRWARRRSPLPTIRRTASAYLAVQLIERLEQPVHVGLAEPSDVPLVVDVPRRGTHQHQPAEAVGLLVGRQHADHGADRVPDKDGALQAKLPADFDYAGVAGLSAEVRARLAEGYRNGYGKPRRVAMTAGTIEVQRMLVARQVLGDRA